MAIFDLKELERTWLLLDANLLLHYYRYRNEPEFGSLVLRFNAEKFRLAYHDFSLAKPVKILQKVP